MNFCNILFIVLSALSLLSSLLVITAKNPVFSTLFLIFTFTNVSCIAFIFNFEFIPISFIIIYVGAIAVLFLFVLLMLNIKLAELLNNKTYFLPFALTFGFLFFIEIIYLLRFELSLFFLPSLFTYDFFLADFLCTFSLNSFFSKLFDISANMRIVAIALFTDYLYCFVLSGVILLLAMVASIVLTLKKNWKNKKQNIYAQLLKNTKKSLLAYS